MKFETESLENSGIQLVDGDRGKNYPKQADFKEQGDCLFLSAKNVTLSGFVFSETSFIDKKKDEILRAGKLQRGDIVVTTRGTIGNIAFYSDDVPFDHIRINSGMMIFRASKDRWNRRFLYFLLTSNFIKQQIESLTSGSAVPQLPARDLKRFLLPNIPIDVQYPIEKIIGALSDKIELNRQTNQTLEQIAQAIFKSWFVDFDPVKAKIKAKQVFSSLSLRERVGVREQDIIERAAMCAISGLSIKGAEEQLKGLGKATLKQLKTTAALFPDALVESELGEIPEGWEISTLSNIATFATKRVDVSELSLENYISTENMLEAKKGVSSASSLPNVKTVPYFNDGQILISNIRPYFKKIWLARFEGGRSNDVLGIEAIDSNCVEYLYNLLFQDAFFNFMMTTSKGAKMPRGDKVAIMGWLCVQPTLDVMKSYSKTVEKIYKFIDSTTRENESLVHTRDALLPKLLSGEVELITTQSDLEVAV